MAEVSGTRPAADPALQDAPGVVAKLSQHAYQIIRSVTDRMVGDEYAILDFPDYGNVGDSAIWAGERVLLDDLLKAPPSFIAEHRVDWARLDQRLPTGPIFLQGGGNFGDVWPHHQWCREQTLARHPRRPVVQLPQSIHFSDEAAIKRCAQVIRNHQNFVLLVRDRPSLAFAQERFECETLLCPDAAFAMGVQQRRGVPDLDVLLLLRTDKEKVLRGQAPRWPEGWMETDWLEDDAGLHAAALARVRREALLGFSLAKLRRQARELRYYDELASLRVERGLRLLSRGRVIITDRLHVHILSTLLGIPHVCLDNSYGKIGRLSEAFGTAWNRVRFVRSLSEARDAAESLLRDLHQPV